MEGLDSSGGSSSVLVAVDVAVSSVLVDVFHHNAVQDRRGLSGTGKGGPPGDLRACSGEVHGLPGRDRQPRRATVVRHLHRNGGP